MALLFHPVRFFLFPLQFHGDARAHKSALPDRQRVERVRKNMKFVQAVMIDHGQIITAFDQFFTILI